MGKKKYYYHSVTNARNKRDPTKNVQKHWIYFIIALAIITSSITIILWQLDVFDSSSSSSDEIINNSSSSSTGLPSSSSSSVVSSSSTSSSSSSVVPTLSYNFLGPSHGPAGTNTYDVNLRKSSTQLVRIAWIGDSISAGSFASTLYPFANGKTTVALLQARLQALYGDGGSGFISGYQGPANAANQNNCYTQARLPVDYNGFDWPGAYPVCGPSAMYFTSPQPNAKIDFYARGSIVEVYYISGQTNLASFTIQIDQGIINTITPVGSSNDYVISRAVYNVVGGEHRVVITKTSTGVIGIFGVAGLYTRGIVIDNYSIPGQGTNNVIACETTQNPAATGGGGKFYTADLVVGALGVNDGDVGGPSLYQSKSTAFYGRYRSAGINSFIFIMPNAKPYSGYNYGQNVATYGPVLTALGVEFNAYSLDLNNQQSIGSYQDLVSLGFYPNYKPLGYSYECGTPGISEYSPDFANNIHPSDIGHDLMATALLPYFRSCSNPSTLTGCAPKVTPLPPLPSSSSSTGVSSSSSSISVTSSSVQSSKILDMPLSTNYVNANGEYPTGVEYRLTSNQNWPTNCQPTFVGTELPGGQAGTAYFNPCATNQQAITVNTQYSNDFTTMIWAKKTDTSANSNILMCASSIVKQDSYDGINNLQPCTYTYGTSPQNLQTGFLNDASSAAPQYSSVNYTVWVHTTVTYTSSTGVYRIYTNGVLRSTGTASSAQWIGFTKPTIHIGGTTQSSSQRPFVGYLYKAKVFNFVMADSDILNFASPLTA